MLVAAIIGIVTTWLTLDIASILGFRLDFAGIQPSLRIPVAWLWPGVVLTLGVCMFAAVWAGWRIGRIAPTLLMSNSQLLKR